MFGLKKLENPILFFASIVLISVFTASLFLLWSNEINWRGTNTKKGADLEQHFIAAQMVCEGKMSQLYHDSHLLRRMQNGQDPSYNFNYVYSPLIAKMMSLVAGKNYLAFYIRWTIASLFLFAIAILILKKVAPKIPFLPIYAIGFPSAAYSIILGQNTFISLLILCAAGLLLNKNKTFSAGLLLSCLFYKPQILLFLAFAFAVMRWWKMLAGIFTGGVIWLACNIAAGGWQNFLDWLIILIGMGASHQQSQNWAINITWVGFLQNFGIRPHAFLWMGIAALPLALASIWLNFSKLKPSEILFLITAFSLPLLPYALSYEILLTLPAFLILVKKSPNSILKNIVLGTWWLTALLSYQPWNSHAAIYAPFLTLASTYLVATTKKM